MLVVVEKTIEHYCRTRTSIENMLITSAYVLTITTKRGPDLRHGHWSVAGNCVGRWRPFRGRCGELGVGVVSFFSFSTSLHFPTRFFPSRGLG